MKPYRYLLFFLMISTLFACKKEDRRKISDLTFPSDTYYVSEGSELFLYINQGNQKYEVEVADESLIDTRVDASLWPAGGIHVTGLKKGSTQLTVTDQVTGQQVTLAVHVVDPYLVIGLGSQVPAMKASAQMPEEARKKIRDEVSAHGTMRLAEIMILHRNDDRQFFVFETQTALHEGQVKDSGSYELSLNEEGEQELTLHYDDGVRTSKFDLVFQSPNSRDVLKSFAGTMANSRKFSGVKFSSTEIFADSPIENFENNFLLKVDLTNEFKTRYPEVEFVWLTQQAELWPNFQDDGKIGDGVL